MKVVLKPSAENSIANLADYISATNQMPETAIKYIDKLLQFAESITHAPNAYTL